MVLDAKTTFSLIIISHVKNLKCTKIYKKQLKPFHKHLEICYQRTPYLQSLTINFMKCKTLLTVTHR